MPRANRYMLPGYCYHLTHRCHDRKFLLKFAKDRNTYRCFVRDYLASSGNVSILNYCITSNHVHFLAVGKSQHAIPEFMHLVQGRFAAYYNRRKRRTGGFWEGRYHATVIETGQHLWRCLQYIDLNMVRAGIVLHPREWQWCGFDELIGDRLRYRLLDLSELVRRAEFSSLSELRRFYQSALEEMSTPAWKNRSPVWTENIAVGSEEFVRSLSNQLTGRQRLYFESSGDAHETWTVRESDAGYYAYT